MFYHFEKNGNQLVKWHYDAKTHRFKTRYANGQVRIYSGVEKEWCEERIEDQIFSILESDKYTDYKEKNKEVSKEGKKYSKLGGMVSGFIFCAHIISPNLVFAAMSLISTAYSLTTLNLYVGSEYKLAELEKMEIYLKNCDLLNDSKKNDILLKGISKRALRIIKKSNGFSVLDLCKYSKKDLNKMVTNVSGYVKKAS